MNYLTTDCFATANTGEGFINHYNRILSNLDYLYIIKGGPGTGKSSLMKRIHQEAISKGLTTERFICSSDPDSLDGLIIKELSIGFTDGTAPHCYEGELPGSHSEILNLGVFWDKNILKENSEQIKELNKKKTFFYQTAYSYLSAALKLKRISDNLTKECVLYDKLNHTSVKLAKKLCTTEGNTNIRLIEGITMDGLVTLDSYHKNSSQVILLKDKYDISHLFLKAVADQLKDTNKIISYKALDPNNINMIYFPDSKTILTATGNATKTINTERFVDKDRYRNYRKTINETKKQESAIMENAYKYLSMVKEAHFELEKIYSYAMNFEMKEALEEELIKEIFS